MGLALVEATQLGSGVVNNSQDLYTAASAFTDTRAGATLADPLRRGIDRSRSVRLHGQRPNRLGRDRIVEGQESRQLVGQPRGANQPPRWTGRRPSWTGLV